MSEITWYGHSAFRISSSAPPEKGVVLIDPFFTQASGMSAENTGAVDLVLVTHDHADHVGEAVAVCKNTGAMLGAIVGTASRLVCGGLPENQVLNGIGFNMGGTITYKGISVTMVQAFHSSESGSPVGYIVTMPDGLIVYHAGDTCIFKGMEIWGQLYAIDVALLPIGGLFTMDARQAALACKLLQCKAVVPMHWGTFPILAQNTDEFKKALNGYCPQCQCVDLQPDQSFTVQGRR